MGCQSVLAVWVTLYAFMAMTTLAVSVTVAPPGRDVHMPETARTWHLEGDQVSDSHFDGPVERVW